MIGEPPKLTPKDLSVTQKVHGARARAGPAPFPLLRGVDRPDSRRHALQSHAAEGTRQRASRTR